MKLFKSNYQPSKRTSIMNQHHAFEANNNASSKPEHNTHCPLLSLPPELRNYIYTLYLDHLIPSTILHLPTYLPTIPLRAVSRQLRHEVLSLLYTTRLICVPRPRIFPTFIACLGSIEKKCIRSVRITYTLVRCSSGPGAGWSVEEDHAVLEEFESLREIEIYVTGRLVSEKPGDPVESRLPRVEELEGMEQFRLLKRLRRREVKLRLVQCGLWWLESLSRWGEWQVEIARLIEGRVEERR
ncbi:hypothetical protein BU16DRAFT_67631 [Lophium mytilinum]|uniref:F-box domain-containing protein n=1 Tax=Lophium mytilinum TaxID=390894 RepID=A0A6A6QPB4_9PEZI|nr:hypothetical protein BU16DRAFT_67631 [Lophium mytilinum]